MARRKRPDSDLTVASMTLDEVETALDLANIAERLPPQAWKLELIYACIRLHEDAIREKSGKQPGYEPSRPSEIVMEVRRVFDDLLASLEPSARRRNLFLAYWERGIQDDLFDALQARFAEMIAANEEGQSQLSTLLLLFLSDPNYRNGSTLSFYGAPAMLLHVAQRAGIDHERLLADAFRRYREEQQPG
jgi:hypothetical protein